MQEQTRNPPAAFQWLQVRDRETGRVDVLHETEANERVDRDPDRYEIVQPEAAA